MRLVLLDAAGEVEDLCDGHRARRDRHDHVLQTFLDPFGDLDLAFTREELDRAHLAHVHPNRIGGAAEFGIERRYRGLRRLFDVLGGRRGRGIRHQQRLGIRGFVVHLDAHVADHVDDALDLLGVEHVVGQVIVDLGEGEEAALLAEDDQRLQPALARLDVGRREHARRDFGVTAVAALLAGSILRTLAGDLCGDLTRGGLVRGRCGSDGLSHRALHGLRGRDDRLRVRLADELQRLGDDLVFRRRLGALQLGFLLLERNFLPGAAVGGLRLAGGLSGSMVRTAARRLLAWRLAGLLRRRLSSREHPRLRPGQLPCRGLARFGLCRRLAGGLRGLFGHGYPRESVPNALQVGAIGKTSNYIILSIGLSRKSPICPAARVRAPS